MFAWIKERYRSLSISGIAKSGNRNITRPETRRSRLLTSSIVALFFNFTIFLSIPATIYVGNISEYEISLGVIITISTATIGLLTMCLLLISETFSVKKYRNGISILLTLSVLIWFQSNILAWNYGPLDGRVINWGEYWSNGIVDSPIWLLSILIAIVKFENIYWHSRYISIIFICVQLMGMAFEDSNRKLQPDRNMAKNYNVIEGTKYEYSIDQNIILILLDEFQSDIFLEIVKSETSYGDIFDGFVYFRNATSGSTFTELAIPSILTGSIYDNSYPKDDYLRNEYLNRSIPKLLMDLGYAVELYPWLGWGNESIYFSEELARNIVKKADNVNSDENFTEKKAKEILHLFELTIFRFLPHYAKRYIFNDGNWLITDIVSRLPLPKIKKLVSVDEKYTTNIFVNNAVLKAEKTSKQKSFKYYHTTGVHRPLIVDGNLKFTKDSFEYNRQNYINQAKANLKQLARYFDKLRSIGAYDNSMIIVMSDHGSGGSEDMYISDSNKFGKALDAEGNPFTRNFKRDKARALPLVLIKKFQAEADLEISNAPVSVTDTKATVLSEIGVETEEIGISMFNVNANENRTRYYAAFDYMNSEHRNYISSITMYAIAGDAWSDDSWKQFRIIKPPRHE